MAHKTILFLIVILPTFIGVKSASYLLTIISPPCYEIISFNIAQYKGKLNNTTELLTKGQLKFKEIKIISRTRNIYSATTSDVD